MLKTLIQTLVTSTLLCATLFTVAGATVKNDVKSTSSTAIPAPAWFQAELPGGSCTAAPAPRPVHHRVVEGCTETVAPAR